MLDYRLIRSRRRTLEIAVKTDASVVVRAPLRLPVSDIERFIEKKKVWIERKKHQQSTLKVIEEARIAPGGVMFLGERRPLRVSEGLFDSIDFSGGVFHVLAQSPSDWPRIETLLQRWIVNRAEVYFRERIPAILQGFPKSPRPLTRVVVKRLKSRWGSCSPEGKITLNAELMHRPPKAIDYVIAHEISHLFYLNHGKGFYRVLSQALPDWKAGRKQL